MGAGAGHFRMIAVRPPRALERNEVNNIVAVALILCVFGGDADKRRTMRNSVENLHGPAIHGVGYTCARR